MCVVNGHDAASRMAELSTAYNRMPICTMMSRRRESRRAPACPRMGQLPTPPPMPRRVRWVLRSLRSR